MTQQFDDCLTEIHDLVVLQAEGRLTSTEALRLETLVSSSQLGLQTYVRYVRDTASLRFWASHHAFARRRPAPRRKTCPRKPNRYRNSIC